MRWGVKNKNCSSCNTTLYPHRSNGLCTKCKRVYEEIEKLKNANEGELEDFRYKYISIPMIYEIKSKDIEVQKDIIKSKIENKKLLYLRLYGAIESRKINVDIVKLEMILNEVAHRVTKKDNFYTNKLLYFNTRFNEEQREIIALKLLRMLINK
jgi:hypothetical protein